LVDIKTDRTAFQIKLAESLVYSSLKRRTRVGIAAR